VPLSALLLALGAAFLHALWNVLLARRADPVVAGAVMIGTAPIAFAPAAVAAWDLDWAAAPFVAGSVAFQLVYFVLLTRAYALSELSLVYPLARGLAPVAVLVVTVLALSADLSYWAAVGVVVVAAGVLMVRGLGRPSDPRGVLFGLSIAGCIAGYTIIDSYGIRHAGPIAYFELVTVAVALLYVPLVVQLRGARAVRQELRLGPIAAGVAAFGAYALVLAALGRSPAAPVAAVRDERRPRHRSRCAAAPGARRTDPTRGRVRRQRRSGADRRLIGCRGPVARRRGAERRNLGASPPEPIRRGSYGRCRYFGTREATSFAACDFLRAALFGWRARVAAARSSTRTSSRCSAETASSSPSSTASRSRLYRVFAVERQRRFSSRSRAARSTRRCCCLMFGIRFVLEEKRPGAFRGPEMLAAVAGDPWRGIRRRRRSSALASLQAPGGRRGPPVAVPILAG
jgi:multidrug transporter EmrE-like cation transporter